jgi:uncharacterized protein (UPF0212 family)
MHTAKIYGKSPKQPIQEKKMKNEIKKVPCRYCKQEVEMGVKRCPHCGTHNPSMNVKRAMIWTVSGIVVLYLIGFMLEVMKG